MDWPHALSLDTTVVLDWFTVAASRETEESVDLRQSTVGLHWDAYTRQQVAYLTIPAIVLAHNKLRQAESAFAAIQACVSFADGGGNTRGRLAAGLLTTLLDSLTKSNPELTEEQRRLLAQGALLDLAQGRFLDQAEHIFSMRTDCTGCRLGDFSLGFDSGMLSFSNRSGGGCSGGCCKVEGFWSSRADDLTRLAQSSPSRDKDRRVKAAAEAVHAGTTSPRGQVCRGPLSDAVIYLCSYATGAVATTNHTDFCFVEANTSGRSKVIGLPPPRLRPPPAPAAP